MKRDKTKAHCWAYSEFLFFSSKVILKVLWLWKFDFPKQVSDTQNLPRWQHLLTCKNFRFWLLMSTEMPKTTQNCVWLSLNLQIRWYMLPLLLMFQDSDSENSSVVTYVLQKREKSWEHPKVWRQLPLPHSCPVRRLPVIKHSPMSF